MPYIYFLIFPRIIDGAKTEDFCFLPFYSFAVSSKLLITILYYNKKTSRNQRNLEPNPTIL